MQSSDLTKFKFAANIAGPYCSACCAGGGGSVGPTGPTGPTGPAGGDASTWSQYPATQAVDVNCNFLNDVSGINFCDGTYIGPGGSFDISSNQNIVIKSTQDTEIRNYDITGSTIETYVKVEGAGKVSITEGQGQTATLRLENQGGKGGEIIASETGGFMAVQAQAGYNLTLESTDGNVNIASANANTNVSIDVNGGSAGMTLTDSGGNGSINMSATDTGTGTTNSLVIDPVTNAITGTANSFTLNGPIIYAFNGAVEGAEMGYDNGSLNNFVAGLGNPFDVKQSRYDDKYIRFDTNPANKITANAANGSIELLADNGAIGTKLEVGTAFTGVLNGINPDTGLLVDAGGGNPTAQLIIDSATAMAGLQYNGTSPTPVQFHFTGGDFLAGTSGGASGQYLRIFVNGVEYKIALLNA